MTAANRPDRGFGHLGLLVIMTVVAVMVLAGIRVWQSRQAGDTVSQELKTALAKADCTSEPDPQVCKFLVSVAAQPFTTVEFTEGTDGRTGAGTYQTDNERNYHIAHSRGTDTYEAIGIDATLYSRDPDNKKYWWEQDIRRSDIKKYNAAPGTDLAFATAEASRQASYRQQGSAPCPGQNQLTCLKYQITAPAEAGLTRFIWFDTAHYQLWRVKTLVASTTTDATFGYSHVTIDAPEHTKKLPANRYIVPGQSEPVTVPEGGLGNDVSDLLE